MGILKNCSSTGGGSGGSVVTRRGGPLTRQVRGMRRWLHGKGMNASAPCGATGGGGAMHMGGKRMAG